MRRLASPSKRERPRQPESSGAFFTYSPRTTMAKVRAWFSSAMSKSVANVKRCTANYLAEAPPMSPFAAWPSAQAMTRSIEVRPLTCVEMELTVAIDKTFLLTRAMRGLV
jgi:hypothetical protein